MMDKCIVKEAVEWIKACPYCGSFDIYNDEHNVTHCLHCECEFTVYCEREND